MPNREPFSSIETGSNDAHDEPSNLDSTASRRDFLRSGLLLGAATTVALSLSATPAHALKLVYGDAQRLQFLVEVQAMQADFFRRAAQSVTADGLQEREMTALGVIAQEDGQQMRWCEIALKRFGGTAFEMAPGLQSASKTPPSFDFGADTFKTRENLLQRAIELKTISASAWMGAAGDCNKAELCSALASLGGVQNRHLAILQDVSGQSALLAMAPPMSPEAAYKALEKAKISKKVLF